MWGSLFRAQAAAEEEESRQRRERRLKEQREQVRGACAPGQPAPETPSSPARLRAQVKTLAEQQAERVRAAQQEREADKAYARMVRQRVAEGEAEEAEKRQRLAARQAEIKVGAQPAPTACRLPTHPNAPPC